METSQTSQQCTMCGKAASDRCKQCHSSSYCSRECQKADWPIHRLLCPTYLASPTPPHASSNRAILFPVAANAPQFVWVKCSWRTLDGERYQHVDKAEFLGTDVTDRVWVQLNKTRSRSREDVLTVYMRESACVDGSLLNRCVIAVARGRYVNFCWPGPLLVVRSSGLTLGDSVVVDTDMVDLRDAVDVLCSYPDLNINITEPEETWEVQGVRVNCAGEMKIYGRGKFEEVRVANDNKVFDQPVPRISQLLGLPVRVIRCSKYKETEGYGRGNSEVTFLHMDANPKSSTWGWAPMEWQEPAGNVLVVREDRKPLRQQHVEVLCRYCLDVLQPLFEESIETGRLKHKVMEKMTKGAFGEYWKEYGGGRSAKWKAVESPV